LAHVAYRRRFLLEKYPQLGDEQKTSFPRDIALDAPDDTDETISVRDEVKEAGGPDLE
jgi:hypothetical protein